MLWIVVGAVCAFVITILWLNFTGGEKRVDHAVSHQYGVRDAQFQREMGTLLGPAILPGNHVENLENGAEIFPAMLAAVEAAQHTITFETYIYWSGDIGERFAKALATRAKAGVKVHVLLDWVGSQKVDDTLIDHMKSAGVEVEYFHPLHWYTLGRINNRTHRKLLVVDGRVGFTGGVGIADQWNGHAEDPGHWRDSHYQLRGPAVAQMQAAFMDNWIKTTGRVLSGEAYFPSLPREGDTPAQVFIASPSGGGDSMMLMYLMAIAAAEHTVDLSAAYFVPDDLMRQVIADALRRGVKIRIVVPGEHIDTEVVRKASRAEWGDLLSAGARIFEYQPTMFHCKMLIVDGHLVSVGSTNFDNRSFRLNEEANLNLYDDAFAQRVTGVFEQDLQKAREITHAQWLQRPWREKALERLASLFSSQL
ncbi:cardiolipin synthase [Pseudoxanthomonas sp. SL93]|uniref:cardiolipin synthase n=1 Tax=Pseudoxanthomonas sp. SL93 TaxID=2995142 RepID=UPI0022708855|nr:cardiolipin synthase [Pseudoxanthomonas sp. SL93]WAC63849.1 cardiolipin synthase [Pseudoxanthomonas sp. SL93]